jgi:hypothetical protein
VPKYVLEQHYVHAGTIYTAGEQDVPQALIDHIEAQRRTAEEHPEPEGLTLPPASDPLAGFPALVEAGYTVEAARAARDDELLALKGFGKASLAKFREAHP